MSRGKRPGAGPEPQVWHVTASSLETAGVVASSWTQAAHLTPGHLPMCQSQPPLPRESNEQQGRGAARAGCNLSGAEGGQGEAAVRPLSHHSTLPYPGKAIFFVFGSCSLLGLILRTGNQWLGSSWLGLARETPGARWPLHSQFWGPESTHTARAAVSARSPAQGCKAPRPGVAEVMYHTCGAVHLLH